LGRGGRDGASHQQANHPIEFTQDAGIRAKIVEPADRNLNRSGKIAGCHAVLQDKILFRTDAVDGLGPQVGVMLDEALIEIAGLQLVL
jgi:hypothetical protein